MLRPGFPRLSHPEVAHAIPSVGFMAQVYRRVRLLVSPTIVGVQLTDQQRTAQAPTHGYRDLHFAHFGVPHAYNFRQFVYQTDNLLALPHDVSPDTAQVENTDFEDTMTLKEEIEKWRKDHGE